MRTSMTSVPRAAAISASDRPTHFELGIGDLHEARSPRARPPPSGRTSRRPPAGPPWSQGRRPRLAGRPRRASRTSRQPGTAGRRLSARIRIMSGRASAITWAPRAVATSDALELLLVDLLRRQAAEQVPVEGPVGGQGHVGHELHALVGDRSHRRDELECRAGVAPQRAGQGDDLCEGGTPGRDRSRRPRRGGPLRATTRIRALLPPATASTRSTMAASCSGVAASRVASSPMTARRIVE